MGPAVTFSLRGQKWQSTVQTIHSQSLAGPRVNHQVVVRFHHLTIRHSEDRVPIFAAAWLVPRQLDSLPKMARRIGPCHVPVSKRSGWAAKGKDDCTLYTACEGVMLVAKDLRSDAITFNNTAYIGMISQKNGYVSTVPLHNFC